MSALSDSVAARLLVALQKVGVSAQFVVPNAVYSGGEVTETPETHTVVVAGPVDEQRQYSPTGADTRVTGTFYLSAAGITFRPTNGCRLVVVGRTWVVTQSGPISLNGSYVAWSLLCAEIGT